MWQSRRLKEERIYNELTAPPHKAVKCQPTILGLDDLITTELDSLDEVSELLTALLNDGSTVLLLGEKRDDGDTGVTTDDGNIDVFGVLVG